MSNRIARMSKRRRKIAWRKLVAAEFRKAFKPLVGMPYNDETYTLARKLAGEALDKIVVGKQPPPIAILHEGATIAFFTYW